METINNKIFQIDSEIVQKARTFENYLIIEDERSENEEVVCAVYFASNYIYYPNTEESFKKSIFEKNRYEWWNLKHPKANKHIFIRDVYKQWYIHGINNDINSIPKMKDFLKKEIDNNKSIFIGSSAGGYMAVLLGSMVGASKIYNFNGQFFLTDLLETSKESVDPLIFREQNNSEINKYYNIKSYIKKPSNIFYFHSSKSSWDVRQYAAVKDLALNVINVNTDVHGIPLLKNNLAKVFRLSDNELIDLTKKRLNPILFSVKIVGFYKTLKFIGSIIPQIYNRKILTPFKNLF